jgi:hypothetical protein
MSANAVNVELVDELWLVWDPSRGHWTLGQPAVVNRVTGAGAPGLMRDDVRVLRRGDALTLIWPERA